MKSIQHTQPAALIDGDARRRIDRQRLKAACNDFEAMLIARMLKEMRKTNESIGETEGIIKKTENPFIEMFDWEMSRSFARSGPLGISEALMRSLDHDEPTGAEGGGIERGKSRLHPEELQAVIEDAAKRYDVDPALIRSVVICESNGDPGSVSRRNAKGLMQLMDETARDLGVTDPFDPVQNVFGGTRYLRDLLDTYDNNIELALAAYNAGPAAVEEHDGVPPFPETRSYIRRVLDMYNDQVNR